MERDKLLYELEYQVNKLRKIQLNAIEYNDLSVKELLDLGFDSAFIRIGSSWYNLGYKWKMQGKTGYESSDFGELNDKQLNCMVKYVSDDISDYNYQQVSVELIDEKDNMFFLGDE